MKLKSLALENDSETSVGRTVEARYDDLRDIFVNQVRLEIKFHKNPVLCSKFNISPRLNDAVRPWACILEAPVVAPARGYFSNFFISGRWGAVAKALY